jgi:hypothetical protein
MIVFDISCFAGTNLAHARREILLRGRIDLSANLLLNGLDALPSSA